MTVTTFTFDNPAAVVTWTVPNHTGTLTIIDVDALSRPHIIPVRFRSHPTHCGAR